MRQEKVAVGVLALLLNASGVCGFLLLSKSVTCIATSTAGKFSSTRQWSSKLFGPDEEQEEGKELAKQFYEQIRQREAGSGGKGSVDGSNAPPKPVPSDSSMSEPEPADSLPKKKFTGATTTIYTENPVPAAPFGSNRNDSEGFRSSNPERQTPREQMMEREFQLVGRAERGLKYQALLAVGVAILYAYVGFTGGIQSGGEIDAVNDFGGDDMINDVILPIARDSEASYWL